MRNRLDLGPIEEPTLIERLSSFLPTVETLWKIILFLVAVYFVQSCAPLCYLITRDPMACF